MNTSPYPRASSIARHRARSDKRCIRKLNEIHGNPYLADAQKKLVWSAVYAQSTGPMFLQSTMLSTSLSPASPGANDIRCSLIFLNLHSDLISANLVSIRSAGPNMALRATIQPVKLDSNSLYIYTLPRLSNTFHWALVHIDEKGVATRHHWAATTLDPQGPEAYVEQALPHGPLSKVEKDHILAYFKISEYRPIDVTTLRRTCASIFPKSYPTAQANRRADITCRAWITHILGQLISPERAQEIEELVKKHSTTCSNTFATDFLFQRPYEMQVYTL